MATAAEIRRLTEAYRREQVREAGTVAALVAAYYARQVVLDDEASVDRWLEIMVPRILARSDRVARLAATYAEAARRLELPDVATATFEPAPGHNAEQIRRSLLVVGPEAHRRKMTEISAREVPDTPSAKRAEETMRRALEKRAATDAVTKITGAATRHAQAGGRNTLERIAQNDRVAKGYVRATRADPCYFCAMLASRGPIYSEGSFDASDPRFMGPGDAKVHDSCRCSLKPVYTDEDPYVGAALDFEAMWLDYSGGPDGPLIEFRRGYEGRKRS